MAIFYILMTIIILKKINEEEIVKKEDFEEKYNPILNQFLLKNEFIPDEKLIKEELSNLQLDKSVFSNTLEGMLPSGV